VCERDIERDHACVREREGEKERVCGCVREREREIVCEREGGCKREWFG